ncbi:MAG: hypothetical protein ACFFCI_01015 [Promethearchaeota archaeon]
MKRSDPDTLTNKCDISATSIINFKHSLESIKNHIKILSLPSTLITKS